MSSIGLGISPVFGPKLVSSYIEKVLALSPIAYWPLNETSGAVADNAEETAARDGAYTGVTLNDAAGPDYQPVPLFDGANDFCNIYGTNPNNLDDVFDFDEGSVSIWAKVYNAGVWTDGIRRSIFRVFDSAANFIYFYKNTVSNQIRWQFVTGGAADIGSSATVSSTDWVHIGVTWSITSGEYNQYINGVATVDSPIAFSTPNTATHPFSSNAVITGSYTTTPANVYYGWLAHPAVFDSALSAADILALATI